MENQEIADIYINKDEQKEHDCMKYIHIMPDNQPYTNLKRKFVCSPYNLIGGLRPYHKSELETTSAKTFNKEMDTIYNNTKNQEDFYLKMKDFQKNEVNFIKTQHKNDHIKKIFLTLNFKSKDTTYNEAFDYDKQKEKETLENDFTNHKKKYFEKTYEESKIKHKIIIRK